MSLCQVNSTKNKLCLQSEAGYPINPTIPKDLFRLAIERVMGKFRALGNLLQSDGQRNKSSGPESKASKLPPMATHVDVKGRNVTEKKCPLYTRQEAVAAPERKCKAE